MGKIIEIIGEENDEVITEVKTEVTQVSVPDQKPCSCDERKAKMAKSAKVYCTRLDRVGAIQELTAIIFLCTAIIAFVHWVTKKP